MKWIGLTGGLGTGKSTVADILRRKGYSVLDADRKAREVVEKGSEGLQALVQLLGKGILQPDGSLDRKKLGQMMFSDPELRAQVEGLLHPLIQESVARDRAYLRDQGLEVCFYDVPLLFEKKLESNFDAVILVACSDDLQRKRVRLRNQWDDEEITRRLSAQMPISEKLNLTAYVINNEGSLGELEEQIDKTLHQIFKDLKVESPT